MESPAWASLSDDELLEKKISQLGLKLDGTKLQALIQQLYDELSQKGLTFHPPCHIGDEWFVPVGIPAIFIPFFLTHDRLRHLERKIILEVEGETSDWFMKLIRHEAAHAYAYAYQVFRKRKWQRTFGLSSAEETPSFYRPRPYSRSFVVHLEDWYAQSHPDEDFAETFAVWLQPRTQWRRRYAGWPALAKLEYVDRLMASLADRPPLVRSRRHVEPIGALSSTLKAHYDAMRAHYAPRFPRAYDHELRQLFSSDPRHRRRDSAASFLRRHRAGIRGLISRWLGGHEFTLELVLDDPQAARDIPRAAEASGHHVAGVTTDGPPWRVTIEV